MGTDDNSAVLTLDNSEFTSYDAPTLVVRTRASGNAKPLTIQDSTQAEVTSVSKTGVLSTNWATVKLKTLPTCASGIEGQVASDAASGVSTGAATRLCYCQSNGSASYAWRNIITGTVGTSTTCSI